jgi:hypothetical protein
MAEALISGWIMKTGVCWVWLMKEAPEPIAPRSGLPFKWLILEYAPLLPHAGIHFVQSSWRRRTFRTLTALLDRATDASLLEIPLTESRRDDAI